MNTTFVILFLVIALMALSSIFLLLFTEINNFKEVKNYNRKIEDKYL